MADITDFYPGGAANQAVPHATNAVETDSVDDQAMTTPLYYWSGTQEEYDAIDATTFPNYSRTIFYTT